MSNLKTYKGTYFKGYLPDHAHIDWSEKEWEQHNNFVKECKADGTFGEKIEVKITMKENPLFDIRSNNKCLDSYKLIILDFSKK